MSLYVLLQSLGRYLGQLKVKIFFCFLTYFLHFYYHLIIISYFRIMYIFLLFSRRAFIQGYLEYLWIVEQICPRLEFPVLLYQAKVISHDPYRQIDSQIIIMFNDTSTLDNTLLLPTYYYLENKYLQLLHLPTCVLLSMQGTF